MHAQPFIQIRDLIFGLPHHLQAYFACVIKEGSDETMKINRLV